MSASDKPAGGAQGASHAPYSVERRYERHKLDLRVKLFRFLGKQQTMARGNDISYGGIALYAPVEIAVGERVRLDFSLPYSTQPLVLEGIVRNRNGFRMGVEFLNVAAAQREAIDKMCRLSACAADASR